MLVICRDVETLSDDVSVEKAMEALKSSKRKSLPVVDSNGNLVSLSVPNSFPSSHPSRLLFEMCLC